MAACIWFIPSVNPHMSFNYIYACISFSLVPSVNSLRYFKKIFVKKSYHNGYMQRFITRVNPHMSFNHKCACIRFLPSPQC